MEKKAVLIGGLLVLTAFHSAARSDEVGLFFDEAGTVTCANSVMVPLDVYLVARDLTYPDAIAGWEMTLEPDANIVLGGIDCMGEAINVGAFPSVRVGLAKPLVPRGNLVLLAKVRIFATGEGGIHIRGHEPPSIPGSRKPIYSVFGTDKLMEMDVFFPDGMSGQAMIALDCTTVLAQTTPLIPKYGIAGAKDAFVAEGRYTMDLTPPVAGDPLARVELELFFADIAFVGEVEDVEYKCLTIPDENLTSLAFVQFRVKTPICGVAGNRIVIETVVDRPENCITYEGVTLFREFLPGEQFLVAAERKDVGRAKVWPNSIWRYNDGDLIASSGESSGENSGKNSGENSGEKGANSFADLIQRIKSQREFVGQARKADLVAVVRIERVWHADEIRYADATVTKVEKGVCERPGVTIVQSDGRNDEGDVVIHRPMTPGEEYLAFLRESSGVYEPVYGRLSFFALTEGGILQERRGEWGPLAMAEALIEGAK